MLKKDGSEMRPQRMLKISSNTNKRERGGGLRDNPKEPT